MPRGRVHTGRAVAPHEAERAAAELEVDVCGAGGRALDGLHAGAGRQVDGAVRRGPRARQVGVGRLHGGGAEGGELVEGVGGGDVPRRDAEQLPWGRQGLSHNAPKRLSRGGGG